MANDNWQLKAILSAVDKMTPVLKNVSTAARSTRKYLADVGSSSMKLAQQVGVPLGLLSGAAGALSVAGLKKVVTDFTDETSRISDKSKALSMTTDDFQRLGFMAKMSGTDIEAMGGSLSILNKRIAEAAAGKNKELAGLLSRAGISMRGANGQLRSGVDLLPEVADLFQKNGNAAVQARMGNALYGKSWQTMAPLLSEGSDGIKELNDRYRALGLGIENSAIKAGDAFGDKLDENRAVINSYAYTIGAKLIPVLGPMLEKFTMWAVENRELIATNVSKYLAEIADSLATVDWSAMIKGVSDLVKDVKEFVNWIGGAKNALIALVLVMNAQAIVAAISLAGSIGRLGIHLTALALKALAPVAPLQTMTVGMKGAELRAASLTNTMGRLTAASGLMTAAMAGWEIGSWAYEKFIAGTDFGDKIGSGVASTLAFFGNDEAKAALAVNESQPQPGAQSIPMSKQPLVGPQARGRVDGEVKINISGLPPGSRVEQVSGSGDMPINLSAGYSSAALGMP